MKLVDYLAMEKVRPLDFARRVGVAASTMSRILSGKRLPSATTAARIAEETGNRVGLQDFVPPRAAPSNAEAAE